MQNSLVKGIIVCIILVILCFMVGSLVTESFAAASSVIVVLVGLVFMLLMGTRSWVLIFLLPPLIELLPFPRALAVVPKDFYVAGLVLVYWLLMWVMRYAKVRWRSLGAIDSCILLLTIVMVVSYIRRPVSVDILGMEGDVIGGAEYVYFLLALTYYLALSCIPINSNQLGRVINVSVALKLGATFILLVMAITGLRGNAVEAMSSDGRLWGWHTYGSPFCIAIFSYFSLRSILVNPILLISAVSSFVPVLLAGSRNYAGLLGLNIIVLLLIKREVLLSVIAGVMAYAMLMVFSLGGGLNDMPLGVQRICAMLPGIQVSAVAVRDGQGTWDWREQLWELAWDKRTGYIKNYVFGDGYGQSRSATERRFRSLIRGEYVYGQDLDEFAVNGVWHHGVIKAIHRVGYVGLSVYVVLITLGVFYVFRVCHAWRGTPLFKPLLFYVTSFAVFPPRFVWGAADLFFHFVHLGILKMAYCMAREEGRIAPLFQRRRYQPLMIQEHGDRIRSV